MNQTARLITVVMAVMGGLAMGIHSHSLVLGVIGGISVFNMWVLMSLTAENL